ncbi:hypothetical protein CEXT_424101 [Caerostris extrusa]|uniref:Uncharacterized protein n=1 Tax=Caerostris extrusa TaxID=172846 RepID=A0AAV4M7N0_CAEEX|nr:hypothetical protein CEXT_424101 [Caerostris extrusa]
MDIDLEEMTGRGIRYLRRSETVARTSERLNLIPIVPVPLSNADISFRPCGIYIGRTSGAHSTAVGA